MHRSARLSDELSEGSRSTMSTAAKSENQLERRPSFRTVSLEEINRLYSPSDISNISFENDIGSPGEFPYTRGIHGTGYRGKLWTMRQFAGFGTPEETN